MRLLKPLKNTFVACCELIAILIILIFLASLYYYSSSEGFTNNKIQHKHRVKASCPDMLIQDGIKIYLD